MSRMVALSSETHPHSLLREPGERYAALLQVARHVAGRIVKLGGGGLSDSPAYIYRESRKLLECVPDGGAVPIDSEGAAFEALRLLLKCWPDIAANRIQGEKIFAGEPGLWKRLMTEWPMREFAQLAAQFMINNDLLGGHVLELGAGVGGCSALVAGHVGENYVRTDLQPFLLIRQKITGTVERYDFNEKGKWQNLDTIFAANAIHCAANKSLTLQYLHEMLRPGGALVLAEGSPRTDDKGTPWALNALFGLFRGWWDVGGYLSRQDWMETMAAAGFKELGYMQRVAGSHDLGGILWGLK